jgi:hypothetical protein
MIGPVIRLSSMSARKNPMSPSAPNRPDKLLCEKAACNKLIVTNLVLAGNA